MEKYHLLIHENLLLLTKVFPALDMENKLQKGMFKKPNTKGMQTVFYSLMCILNPEYCRKFVPWPISFTSDNYQFRVAVIDFIKKECNDFEIPQLLPSLLNKADGVKYVKFLFNFITYVTKVAIMKKYGELLCERPSVGVNFEENLALLDSITTIILVDDAHNLRKYTESKYHFSKWIRASKNNLNETLKEFQTKRQLLFIELKESIPHIRTSDEIIIENLVTEFEREMIQFKRHHDKLKAEANRILKKQEYLLFLINIKKNTTLDTLGLRTIKDLTANENISATVQIPINTLVKKLVTNKTTADCSLCLKYFLSFGRLIIIAHLQRFYKLNLTSKHLMICHTANDISLDSAEKVKRFEAFKAQLEQIISDYQSNQMHNPAGNHRKNSHIAVISHFLALKEKHSFQISVPVQTKNILPGFFVDYDYKNNFMERMKCKMSTSVPVPRIEKNSQII